MGKKQALSISVLSLVLGLCAVIPAMSQKSGKGMSQTGTLLSGSIHSASGQAMEGITVSARVEGSPITTTVFTGSDGQYIFPRMDKGTYHVWAQSVGFNTAKAKLDLDGTAVRAQDFVMNPAAELTTERQMLGSDWAASLPGNTLEERRTKDVLFTSCVSCHQISYPMQNRFDQAGWTKIMDVMKMVNVAGLRSRKSPFPYIDHHEAELAAYLGKARGPNTDLKPNIVTRPKGDATMAVITEYALAPAETPGEMAYGDGSDWSQGLPSSLNGVRGIHEVELDLAGNIWIGNSQDNPNRTIAKIDPKTGEVTNIALRGPNGLVRTSHGMRKDANGIIWFTVSGGDASRFEAQQNGMANGIQSGTANLARLDPATGKVDIIPNPPGVKGVSNDAVEMDGKGKVWVTMNNGAMRYDPETGKFMVFPSLRQKDPQAMIETYGVAGDSAGNGYWTQMSQDIVGKGDVATGKSLEIKIPPANDRMELVTPEDRKAYESFYAETNSAQPWAEGPRRLSGDTRGNAVWVGDFYGDNLAKIDIHTSKVTQYPIPKGSGIYDTIVDKNHMVWAEMMSDDSVAKFDPTTGKWIEYMLPTHGAEPRHISIDDRQNPPVVAVPYSRSSKVAVLHFRTKQDLEALKKQVQSEGLQAQK